MDEALRRGREIFSRCSSCLVLTGAGISAESGVPTFRGAGGLWREHRPEDLVTPQAFARDPRLVWDWYRHRRRLVRGCAPNAGHFALVRLEARLAEFLRARRTWTACTRAPARNYMAGHDSPLAAISAYVAAVKSLEYPAPEHCF